MLVDSRTVQFWMIINVVVRANDTNDAIVRKYFFFKWPSPASFSFIFVFSNKHYNVYNKYMWTNVHPVYSSARIRTHDLQDMSLLP